MKNIVEIVRREVAGSVLPLALMLLVVGIMPVQAEVYKWSDESGQVHYSQEPPPESQAQHSQIVIIDSHTPTPSATPPTEREGVTACGTLALPGKMLNPVDNIAMYRQAISIWQKYLDENSASTDPAIRQAIKDRRCAIGYANKELQALSDIEQGLNSNYEAVRDELAQLQQRVEECDLPAEGDEERSRDECKRQHQDRLSVLKQMLQRLEEPRKRMQQEE